MPPHIHAPLLAVCLGLLLGSAWGASSVPIGCYSNEEGLDLQTVEAGEGGCEESCVENRLPVWGEAGGICYGTIVVPLPALKVEVGECGEGNIALSYWMEHGDADERWNCTAEALPITADYWDGLETVSVTDGVASFVIDGTDSNTVAKIVSKRLTAYGLYSAKMSVPGGPGPVSCMYTTTYDQKSPAPPVDWDEVDYEILNECGDKGCTPASGWANTFKDGTNTWNGTTWGKVMWSDPEVVDATQLYTFSWHENNIFWYKGYEFIYEETSAHHPLPWKPSYTVFALWWNVEGYCQWFGGCGTRGTSFVMTVEDVRQLTCTDKS